MSLKTLFIVIILALSTLQTSAQSKNVSLLTIQQLNKRVSNPDTLYIVNFWATWCAPCVKELPNFDKLQKTYKSSALKVLMVSMDFKSKQAEVKKFAQQHRFLSEVLLADKNNEQEFIDMIDKSWSGALPATLIINNKKHIRKFYEREFTYAQLDKLYQSNL